jgi:hypothetical protein
MKTVKQEELLGADPRDARLYAAAQLLDLLSKLIRRRPRQETGQVVMRMNLWFRIAHWGIMASFPTLVVTGTDAATAVHWYEALLAPDCFGSDLD